MTSNDYRFDTLNVSTATCSVSSYDATINFDELMEYLNNTQPIVPYNPYDYIPYEPTVYTINKLNELYTCSDAHGIFREKYVDEDFDPVAGDVRELFDGEIE